jgi:hypothetical protein
MTMIKTEKKSERKNSHEKLALMASQSAHSSGTTTPIAYSLGHMGAGGNAIAAAASQAIAATQQVKNVHFLYLMIYHEFLGESLQSKI